MHARRWGRKQRRHAKILERDPSLINLPFPIPSIPILGPLLSPLIGGEPWPSKTSSSSHATSTTTQIQETSPPAAPSSTATPNPAPAPSPSSPSAQSPSPPAATGSSGNQSGGSGSSSTGNESGGAGGNGESGGSGNGDSGGGGGSGESSGTDDAGGGGAGDSGSDGGSSSSSGTDSVSGSSPSGSSNNGSHPSKTQSSGGGTTAHVGSGASSASPSVAAGAGTGVDAADGRGSLPDATSVPDVVANVQGGAVISYSTGANGAVVPVTSYTGTLPGDAAPSTSGAASPGATGSSSEGAGSSEQGGSGSGTSQSGSSSSPGEPTESHHGLSQGAIAAIATIAAILFLLLLFLILRRRATAKRLSRRKWWFFGEEKRVHGHTAISSAKYFADHPNSSGTASQRSSFGMNTTPDEWDTFVTPMSTVNGRTNPPSSASTIAVPPVGRQLEPASEMEQVWPSNMSGSIAPPALATTVDKEPLPTIRSPDRTSWDSQKSYSDDSSSDHSSSSAWLTVPASAATKDRSPFLPSPMSVRPFSPSEAWQFPKPPQDDRRQSRTSTVQDSILASSESSDYVTASENPFADFVSIPDHTSLDDRLTAESLLSVDTETASHFAVVETIRRPFVPTMDDEMTAAPGEQVRMLRRFDDGWAYAEKVPTGRRGLIPIDCLRLPEEDLPAFLAAKRLSSYRGAGSPSPLWRTKELSEDTVVGHVISL